MSKIELNTFQISRYFLAIYLFWFHLNVLLADSDLFLNENSFNVRFGIFSNIFTDFHNVLIFKSLSILGIILSSLLLSNYLLKYAGAGLLIIQILLFSLNSLVREVQFEFIGWTLLFYLLLPNDQILASKLRKPWSQLPLLMLGYAYSVSGLAKLLDLNWSMGKYLPFIDSISRNQFALGIFNIFQFGSYNFLAISVLALQLFSILFLYLSRTRYIYLILLTCFQISLLILLNLEQVSIVMLIFHLLCFSDFQFKIFNFHFNSQISSHENSI